MSRAIQPFKVENYWDTSDTHHPNIGRLADPRLPATAHPPAGSLVRLAATVRIPFSFVSLGIPVFYRPPLDALILFELGVTAILSERTR